MHSLASPAFLDLRRSCDSDTVLGTTTLALTRRVYRVSSTRARQRPRDSPFQSVDPVYCRVSPLPLRLDRPVRRDWLVPTWLDDPSPSRPTRPALLPSLSRHPQLRAGEAKATSSHACGRARSRARVRVRRCPRHYWGPSRRRRSLIPPSCLPLFWLGRRRPHPASIVPDWGARRGRRRS